MTRKVTIKGHVARILQSFLKCTLFHPIPLTTSALLLPHPSYYLNTLPASVFVKISLTQLPSLVILSQPLLLQSCPSPNAFSAILPLQPHHHLSPLNAPASYRLDPFAASVLLLHQLFTISALLQKLSSYRFVPFTVFNQLSSFTASVLLLRQPT